MTSAGGGTVVSWFDAAIQVGDRVSWPNPDNPGPSATGGRFMLSREHAEQLLDRLAAIGNDLDTLQVDTEILRRSTPPAEEPVSQGFNRALVGLAAEYGVFDYAIGHIDRERRYVREFRRRLAEALGSTLETDGTNARQFPADDDHGLVG